MYRVYGLQIICYRDYRLYELYGLWVRGYGGKGYIG